MKFQEMPYKRADLEKVGEEIRRLGERLERAISGEEQFQVHSEYYQLTDHVSTQMTLANIRHDINMEDGFYSQEHDYYDQARPTYENCLVEYQKKLFGSRFRPFLEEKIGPVAFTNIELSIRSMDQSLIPLMQEENALTTRYNKLLAGARIPWEGEEKNLSLMVPYLKHVNRGVRKEAWRAYTGFFEKNQEELDDLYDQLVKNRTRQAQTLGGKDYLSLGYDRMQRNDYGPKEVSVFREQVKRYLVPFASKLHERRRSRLGLSRLSYIDEGVFFPEGNPSPVLDPEGILKAGQKMYRELSSETGEFMDFMCQGELFDVLGRKSKRTGGYMTYLPDYHAPFIFANFNGTSGDVDVITHECGHAFQGYLSGMDPIKEHGDITMETAETHSMSMEFFTERWMPLFFGERARDYVEMHFEDSVMFIPYGTMVDEFQHICYEDPGLSPRERRRIWRDLERQYKPHLDYEDNAYLEQGGFWQKQHHIYNYPFYYIDYCIAQVDALQYKNWMDRDFQGAFESYLKLCRLSASDYFRGLLRQVGLSNPFEDCIEKLVWELEKKLS